MSKHTLIVGAGRSAYGAARLLQAQGKAVRISDVSAKYPLEIDAIKKSGIDIVIGPQTPELLNEADSLIVSPGLSPDIPLLEAARAKGLKIRSEIDIALAEFDGQVIGVTGTNGKSTTTSLIAHMLQFLGLSATASGNIGLPPSLLIAEGRAPKTFVLELSSYQLDFSQAIVNRVGVFTSFSEDHMERHKTMENYFAAKWRLLEATESSGFCVVPAFVLRYAKKFKVKSLKARVAQILVDDEPAVKGIAGPLIRLSTHTGEVRGDGIRGVRLLPPNLSFHNQLNILMAALSVQAIQSTHWDRCMESLETFAWLPFRFEEIGKFQKKPIYNDSKSTNVESTLVALKSLQEKSILMLGGYPKGEAFHAIAEYTDRIQTVIAFGQAGPRIAKDLASLKPLVFSTLREALQHLPSLLQEQPAPLVFSPACSSFDEFQNFEERGRFFNQQMISMLDPN